MPFAIQLFFDSSSDTAVRRLWAELASTGVPFPLQDSGNRPHISLAIYSELKTAVCAHLLNSFAQTRSPLALTLASLGIFPGEQAVVFLAPIVSSSLLDLHRQVHQLLQDTGTLPSTYYLPGHWTPHCTLASPSSVPFSSAGDRSRHVFSPPDLHRRDWDHQVSPGDPSVLLSLGGRIDGVSRLDGFPSREVKRHEALAFAVHRIWLVHIPAF